MRSNRHHRAVGVVLVLVTGIVGCGSGESLTSTTGAGISTSTDGGSSAETTTVTGTTTLVNGSRPATTVISSAPTTTLPAPDGVRVGASLVTADYWSVRTVAHGDAYFELSAPAGTLTMSRSPDGISWTPWSSDLTIRAVSVVASNGEELLVSSGWGSSDTQPPTVSVSADDGATWTTSPLPVPVPASPYVVTETQVSALAATDTTALALGTVSLSGDWLKYSAEVLCTDHGQVTGEGGWPDQWTVEFEDGFDLVVDLTEIGMPELAAQSSAGPATMVWTRTGSAWETVDVPFNNSSNQPQLVSGPAGFLSLGSSSSIQFRPPTKLYRSTDGQTWQTSDLPDTFSAENISMDLYLTGGPLGYVLIGETSLAFSNDGVSWTRAADYEDLLPDVSGFLSVYPPAAGPAGFAVSFSDPSGSGVAPRVLISRDGRVWEPVPVPPSTLDAMVAVGEDLILVRPVPRPEVPGADVPVDTAVIAAGRGVGGAGGQRPAAMCEAPESVTLVAYDLETGEYRWHQCGNGIWYALRAVTDETVYVSDIESSISQVLALDAATGETRRTESEAEMNSELPDDAAVPMETAPELNGLRLEGGQDDPLIVTDTTTGQQLWKVRDILAYDDVWAVGDGAVYMAHTETSGDGPGTQTVRAYELRTGEVRWQVEPTGESYPWWVGNGRVFAIWTDLTVLATDTGDILWATDYQTPGFPGMRGVLANHDTVFVTFTSHWGGGD